MKLGDKLFTVSSPNLAELRAELEKANVEAGTAKVNFDRTKALVDAGSLPAKELVTAQQEVAEAQLAVRLASQKLRSLKVAGSGEASFTVTAPRDGVVVEKQVNVGQQRRSEQRLGDGDRGSLATSGSSPICSRTTSASSCPAPRPRSRSASAELDGRSTRSRRSSIRIATRCRCACARRTPTARCGPNAYAQIKFFDPTPAKVALPSSAVLSDGAKSYVYVKEQDGALQAPQRHRRLGERGHAAGARRARRRRPGRRPGRDPPRQPDPAG